MKAYNAAQRNWRSMSIRDAAGNPMWDHPPHHIKKEIKKGEAEVTSVLRKSVPIRN